MESVLTTLAIAGGVTGLLTTLVTVPFSPARFWSWRLRKHAETVRALDPERQKNQHEILMRHADYLAARAAAAYHFPTDWGRLRATTFFGGNIFGIFASAILMMTMGRRPWDGLSPVEGLVFVGVSFTLAVTVGSALVGSFKYTRWHRQRFIKRGCPPNYPVPHTFMDAVREAQRAPHDPKQLLHRREVRARRLRQTGALPEHWKPTSWTARKRREISARVRDRPWYLGGLLR